MAKKIKISRELASEIIDVVAACSEKLQRTGVATYAPVEHGLQTRLKKISEKIFDKLMKQLAQEA